MILGPTPLREGGRQEEDTGGRTALELSQGLGQSSGDTAEMALSVVLNLGRGTKLSS